MSQPKVSIIVPIHNAGSHLDKCLTSLVSQTLKEIEIILVIDCPSDGSDRVAESFAAMDDRIRLIYNEKNLHTGLSRNKGMMVAQGKYIGFQDHDDYCDANMYELLYDKAERENLEVVRCNFYCVYTTKAGENKEQYKYPEVSTGISQGKDWIYSHVSGDNISCVIWNHIYNTDFLRQHNISFMDSRSICSEDSIFFIQVYQKLTRFAAISDYLYYHVFHSHNTGKVYGYRSIKNRISFFEELYSFLRESGISDRQSQHFLSENISRSLYSGVRQALLAFPLREAFNEIKYIKDSNLMMSCINSLYKKENRSVLFRLKPTIIIFLLTVKLIPS